MHTGKPLTPISIRKSQKRSQNREVKIMTKIEKGRLTSSDKKKKRKGGEKTDEIQITLNI